MTDPTPAPTPAGPVQPDPAKLPEPDRQPHREQF